MHRPAILLLLAASLATPAIAAEPVRVLLLDYNLPIEHDVLLSHLCVRRCTAANDCPPALLRDGVDYWNDDFIVYRPRYLGSARLVTEQYQDKAIDLVSFSGHHASGFSGDEVRRGLFETERLAVQLADLAGVERFFSHPSMVLLQGCRTDVKSTFEGDPIVYVEHVIRDTVVRDDDFERLLVAVQQIGGIQEAYRQLFPNACILGYAGTQAPGGMLEIYGQVNSMLRQLAADRAGQPAPRFDLRGAMQSRGRFAEVNRAVAAECARWPCDLCAVDNAHYRPLAEALARHLRRERSRLHGPSGYYSPARQARLERSLEGASFYRNTRWSCAAPPPGTPVEWPEPVDESPFGRLFYQLLITELDGLTAHQTEQLRRELIHRLSRIAFNPDDKVTLRTWLLGDLQWARLNNFLAGPVRTMSTFRQREVFTFLANIDCGFCLEQLLEERAPELVRENAASRLHPGLGPRPFRLALADPEPRVRRLAAERLGPGMPADLYTRLRDDPDPGVRAAADRPLAAAAAIAWNALF